MFQDNGITFITAEEFKSIFRLVDQDNSGKLSLAEFNRFISDARARDSYRLVARKIQKRMDRAGIREVMPKDFFQFLQKMYFATKHRMIVQAIGNVVSKIYIVEFFIEIRLKVGY